jgi:predicted TIM-barrel fold metal-dependent hydrolase
MAEFELLHTLVVHDTYVRFAWVTIPRALGESHASQGQSAGAHENSAAVSLLDDGAADLPDLTVILAHQSVLWQAEAIPPATRSIKGDAAGLLGLEAALPGRHNAAPSVGGGASRSS